MWIFCFTCTSWLVSSKPEQAYFVWMVCETRHKNRLRCSPKLDDNSQKLCVFLYLGEGCDTWEKPKDFCLQLYLLNWNSKFEIYS